VPIQDEINEAIRQALASQEQDLIGDGNEPDKEAIEDEPEVSLNGKG
jgi:hypothetical protein